jgi:GNAT superfamily N-acetyltransferase
LARLALEAALTVPEVVTGDAGAQGLRVTADPVGGSLRGVSVIAEGDGRYAVDLRLVARLAPLVALGETVRRRVRESARRQGLGDRLGSVNVEFAGVLGLDEPLPAPVPQASAVPPAPPVVVSAGARVPPAAPAPAVDGEVHE